VALTLSQRSLSAIVKTTKTAKNMKKKLTMLGLMAAGLTAVSSYAQIEYAFSYTFDANAGVGTTGDIVSGILEGGPAVNGLVSISAVDSISYNGSPIADPFSISYVSSLIGDGNTISPVTAPGQAVAYLTGSPGADATYNNFLFAVGDPNPFASDNIFAFGMVPFTAQFLNTGPYAAVGIEGTGTDLDYPTDPGNWSLTVVPEPTTIISGVLMLLPFGASTLRILRKNRAA
jgi:hypothetical protein